jgi:hypothetical protein
VGRELAGDCAELELVERPEGRQLLAGLFVLAPREMCFLLCLARETSARVDKHNKMRLICCVGCFLYCKTNVFYFLLHNFISRHHHSLLNT